MKKSLILMFLSLVCASTYPYMASAQKATGPKMVLKEQVVDYKEVDEGQIIEHVFQVLNQGDEPLEIRNVKPG